MNLLGDIAQLKKHLAAIARPRDAFENPEGLAEVQNYIWKEFESYGYSCQPHSFELRGQTFQNLIFSKGLSGPPRFIIGAHFDAVPGTPGADDNASGSAAMLEAARLLASMNQAVPVHFVAFNLEEYGMVGSCRYVEHLEKEFGKKTLRQNLLGMISLEMVGYVSREKGSQQLPLILKPFYPDTGNFLALVGDLSSGALLNKASQAFTAGGLPVQRLSLPLKGRELEATRLSDHSAFWDAGLPALLVTDTSFFRNPHYHTPEDNIETLDLDFIKGVAGGAARLAYEMLK